MENTTKKTISRKTLNKSFHHWFYGHLTAFSQEHMQTFGYLTSMLPIVEELYDNKADQEKAMKTYTAFFNTEPQLGSINFLRFTRHGLFLCQIGIFNQLLG